MPLNCSPKQIIHSGHGSPSAPSSCATQGTVLRTGSVSSSDSCSMCDFLCDWHKVTDCSFHRWYTGASDYERRCVSKFLGRVTAGKETFKRQLQAALEHPTKDPTVSKDQAVHLTYKNTEAVGATIRKRRRPDYIIDPNMMSETIAVRPKLFNWPIPPSLALN